MKDINRRLPQYVHTDQMADPEKGYLLSDSERDIVLEIYKPGYYQRGNVLRLDHTLLVTKDFQQYVFPNQVDAHTSVVHLQYDKRVRVAQNVRTGHWVVVVEFIYRDYDNERVLNIDSVRTKYAVYKNRIIKLSTMLYHQGVLSLEDFETIGDRIDNTDFEFLITWYKEWKSKNKPTKDPLVQEHLEMLNLWFKDGYAFEYRIKSIRAHSRQEREALMIAGEYISHFDTRTVIPFHYGERLNDYLAHTLEDDKKIELARSVLQVVDELQSQCQVIHRDLKPGNIIYDAESKTSKLVDYSLAIHVNDVDEATQEVGTLNYRPPEVTHGEKSHYSFKSDNYAVGVILEKIFGENPSDRLKPWIEASQALKEDNPSQRPELAELLKRL